jgi:WD40 repeat protein
MLNCCFSPCGTYIVAGANDCNCYVWEWPFRAGEGEAAEHLGSGARRAPGRRPGSGGGAPWGQQAAAGHSRDAGPGAAARPDSWAALPGASRLLQGAAGPSSGVLRACGPCLVAAPAGPSSTAAALRGGGAPAPLALPPAPEPMALLTGHRNDISMVLFSHAGDALATASNDGTVRVGGLLGGCWVRGRVGGTGARRALQLPSCLLPSPCPHPLVPSLSWAASAAAVPPF